MELTFLTYNIHRAIGFDRKYRLDRIIDICKEVGADVVALQEVDRFVPRSKREDLAHLISDSLGMNYDLGLNVKLKHGHYGNATFSKLPIKSSENLNITWGIKKKRGCLVTCLESPAGEVGILNFHLGLARMEQVRQKKKIIESRPMLELGQKPLVLLGDTNDRTSRLSASFLDSGFRDTSSGSKRNTFPAYAPMLRLDRIFVNDWWEIKEHHVIRNKQTRTASDHLPVFARLRLQRQLES
ncbi:MAG: endonuclease/exonuclease/phosphatase family protein [Leptospirales bacterium]|nr:endonuclease/exonuclease/phosphatase family protein [Leptospirales bacterium]